MEREYFSESTDYGPNGPNGPNGPAEKRQNLKTKPVLEKIITGARLGIRQLFVLFHTINHQKPDRRTSFKSKNHWSLLLKIKLKFKF